MIAIAILNRTNNLPALFEIKCLVTISFIFCYRSEILRIVSTNIFVVITNLNFSDQLFII